MLICRQPTIRSLFFVVAMSALLTASVEGVRSSPKANEVETIHFYVIAVWLIPIALSMVFRLQMFIVFFSTLIFINGLVFIFQSGSSVLGELGMCLLLPMQAVFGWSLRYLFVGVLPLSALLFLSVGPAFTLTCRLRPEVPSPPSEPEQG